MLCPRLLRATVASQPLLAMSAIPLAAGLRSGPRFLSLVQNRTFLPREYTDPKILDEKYPDYPQLSDAEDPGMNGGYINPPEIKRQLRDPFGDWWDKQERRNLGEKLHEDNELLGIFSPYEYNWISAGKAGLHFGLFVATLMSIIGVIYKLRPPPPAYPRELEGGLVRELGGPGAMRARMEGDLDPKP